MWVLFVIDYIVNTHAKDDYKHVRYAEYSTEIECVIDAVDLYKQFTQGEEAICEFVVEK